ncbi:MAG: alanine--tRNA ligase [Phycisphaerales bacterium]|nr:alanine--tRNA ligase [Phycisphaerales bacterium]
MPLSGSDIRRQFIEFFAQRAGHTVVPSSPVVPHDDPTLLFTNAGMNQFKDVFLAQGSRPFTRAVDTQKCIRAGGKHNDLEDVGRDTYHHTFFEMLGNWSFGDYFKAESIEWAWELFTEVWGLDKSRLYVTVFEGDASDGIEADVEAENLWKEKTDIDPSHITRWGKKDNFWEMGETGPCGPCSEIHYDCTPGKTGGSLVNMDDPNVIELWNLVFIQFNRGEDGKLTPLPNQHVDTGMGLERIVRVLQNKTSNYDTDLWTPIFDAIQNITRANPYQGTDNEAVDVAYRVLADHIRCLTVAIGDGGRPGSAGREFVLRRILRRAARHAHQTFGVDGPMLYKLVPSVVKTLGDTFPEIKEQQEHISGIIRDEEESFLKTLDRGLELFDQAVQGGDRKTIDAKTAFTLHDTFGFPIDLTEVMAEERGLSVDRSGYESLMETARETSRATSSTDQKMQLPPDVLASLKTLQIHPTKDSEKYTRRSSRAQIKAIWNGKELTDVANDLNTHGIILDKTPFYAESGGQVGDTGHLITDHHTGEFKTGGYQFNILETHQCGEYVLHIGNVISGELRCEDHVTATVHSDNRKATEANHTSTHLLNHSLRAVLGEDVQQKGSLVDHDRLRFDFSHTHAMTDEEIELVQQLVNKSINEDALVDAKEVPLDDAMQIKGVRAVFGERYPDPVRVVSIGVPVHELLKNPTNESWYSHSVEFCGGTHLNSCATAGQFVITHEHALASGVRRIVALTGVAAEAAYRAGESILERIFQADALKGDALIHEFSELSQLADELTLAQPTRHLAKKTLATLHEKAKSARKKAASTKKDSVLEQAQTIAGGEENIVVATIEGGDKDTMLSALDAVRSKKQGGAVMLFTVHQDEGKVTIVAGVDKQLIDQGLKAGDWVREAAQVCGGGGGGRPDTAQAGGKDPEKIPDAMKAAIKFAKKVTT